MDEILNAAAVGDSDISDDDAEDALLLHLFQNEPLGNSANLYGRFTLDQVTNAEAKSMFRFEKNDIPRLALALEIPERIMTNDHIPVLGVDALCILLRRLAYPNRLKDLENIFGYSDKALSSIYNTVMGMICDNKRHLIENLGNVPWLNEVKLREYSAAIAAREAPVNNSWAFIDGTVRPICRPSVNQREYYSGYKKLHCVKYQSLLCPDGIVINLKGPYPGRVHDAGILRESGLHEELEQFTTFDDRQYLIYGDKGYNLRQLLLRPYTEREVIGNPQRQEFNNIMSSLRVAVEWGFQKVV